MQDIFKYCVAKEVAEIPSRLPKLVLFDIGHVFISASYRKLYQDLSSVGVSNEATRGIFELPEYFDFSRGKIDSHAFCEAIRRLIGSSELTDDVLRGFHDQHITGVIPQMAELLDSLTQDLGSESIAFVTDTCEWQNERQRQLIDLSGYRMFTSNELGMLKTDPEIVDADGNTRSFFIDVLANYAIQPYEALLVDDNKTVIDIAANYGIQTHAFQGAGRLGDELRERGMITI